MLRNAGQGIKLSGQDLYLILRHERHIVTYSQDFLCCRLGREQHEMELVRVGLHAIIRKPLDSITAITSQIRQYLSNFRTMSPGNCRPHSCITDISQYKMNKSFMKMLKRRGPGMEPWGTPFFNTAHELLLFEILTRFFFYRAHKKIITCKQAALLES